MNIIRLSDKHREERILGGIPVDPELTDAHIAAVNSIAGTRCINTCSGHGKSPHVIWRIDDLALLHRLRDTVQAYGKIETSHWGSSAVGGGMLYINEQPRNRVRLDNGRLLFPPETFKQCPLEKCSMHDLELRGPPGAGVKWWNALSVTLRRMGMGKTAQVTRTITYYYVHVSGREDSVSVRYNALGDQNRDVREEAWKTLMQRHRWEKGWRPVGRPAIE